MESLIMLVLMFAIFYFLLIRPENKRKKQAQEMRDSIKKGDTLTTIGGIVGRVVSTTKDTLVIETSDDRVRMEITRWAVSTTGVQTGEQPVNEKKKKKDEAAAESAEESKELKEASQEEPAEKKD